MSPSSPSNTSAASSPTEESSQAVPALERQLSRVKLSRTTSLGSRPVSMDGRARHTTPHTNDKVGVVIPVSDHLISLSMHM
jgi:hypothetical protein